MATFAYKGRLKERSSASHSSADDSFEDKLDPSTSLKRDHSDDSHGASKFSEAMKNPNWRRRREDNSSFTSSVSGSEMSEYSKIKQQMMMTKGSHDSFFPTSHRNLTKIASCQLASTQKDFSESSSVSQQTKDALTTPMEPATGHRDGWAFCNIVGQKQLPCRGVNGAGVSIFEIVPAVEGDVLVPGRESQGASHSTLANIQRVHERTQGFSKAMPMARNEQERSLATIMDVLEDTPPRPRLYYPEYESNHRDESSDTHWPDEQGKSSGSNTRARLRDLQAGSVVSDRPSTTVQSCHNKPELQKKHTAFQKMLQKLQRKVPQTAEAPRRDSRDVFVKVKERSCVSMPERNQRQQLGEGSSDSAIGILPSTIKREKQDSGDSGICMAANPKQLNPRAREFLSFTAPGLPTPGDHGLARLGQDQGASLTYGKLETSCASVSTEKATPDSGLLNGQTPGLLGKAAPSMTPNVPHCLSSSLLGLKPPPGLGVPVPRPPMDVTLPSVAPHTGSALDAATLAALSAMGSQTSLSSPKLAAHHLNLGMATSIPWVGSYPDSMGAGLPYPLWKSVGVPAPPRAPVPKPRKPDTRDQQAYEAWIEWRKATEPGYAMECKNRQQRRARRHLGADYAAPAHPPAQAI